MQWQKLFFFARHVCETQTYYKRMYNRRFLTSACCERWTSTHIATAAAQKCQEQQIQALLLLLSKNQKKGHIKQQQQQQKTSRENCNVRQQNLLSLVNKTESARAVSPSSPSAFLCSSQSPSHTQAVVLLKSSVHWSVKQNYQ